MRPLLYQNSRESLGTSSRETSVFSFLSFNTWWFVIHFIASDWRTNDRNGKEGCASGPKEKCQIREELYLKISRVVIRKEKYIRTIYILAISLEIITSTWRNFTRVFYNNSESTTWKWFLRHFDARSEIKWINEYESNIHTIFVRIYIPIYIVKRFSSIEKNIYI